jgi:hypothetical protein
MMSIVSRGYALAASAVFLATIGWVFAGRKHEGTFARGEVEESPSGPTLLYAGESICAECHNRTEPLRNDSFPPLCRCTECSVWRNRDKHRNAYQVLREPRAQQMGRLLGNKDVTLPETGCIACHGVDVREKPTHKTFSAEEGVTCVVCHGPYREWVKDHAAALEREEWRKLPREAKEKKFGMTDLWDPAKRTDLCVSCHIGNTEQGKFVSHAMYAAGHPPLPGIEIAAFSDQMPRHWQLVREKSAPVQEALGFRPGSQHFEQTKLVAIGSITDLAKTMKLLATQADKCAQAKDGEERVLDLSNFDCYACHHDLKSPSWRQQRGYVGKPGRPQMRPWPTRLARVSLEEIVKNEKASKDLDEGIKNVHQAFSAQPFGSSPDIAIAAKTLATQLDQWSATLARTDVNYDEATAVRLLQRLCSSDPKDIPDYDSAREIAWAISIIYCEWKPDPKDRDQNVVQVLQALKHDLKLLLPEKSPRPEQPDNEVIIRALPESLACLNDYDPKAFKGNLKKLFEYLFAK